MRRISSKATFYYKRIVPVKWFGLVAVLIAGGLYYLWANPAQEPGQMMIFIIAPIIMAVVGDFVMQTVIFDLVDAVLDGGNVLIVRNGDQEDRIAFADIVNVGDSGMSNPSRVTLSLRRPSRFGEAITFCAPLRFLPYARHPLVEELIRRIDESRRR
jgi:hypothetical protein